MTDEKEKPAWDFIRLEKYSPPSQPAAETVRKSLLGIFASFRKPAANSPDAVMAQPSLASVPAYLLERAAAPPNWEVLLPGMAQEIGQRLESKAANPISLFVHAPNSGVPGAITAWAKENNWWIIEPPATAEVLDSPEAWIERLAEIEQTPIAIPDLALFYRRHHAGFKLIQDLLAWIHQRSQPCLLGCSSWAWAYLVKAISLQSFLPAPLALSPRSADDLAEWFTDLSAGVQKFGFVFRQADTGKFVLAPAQNGSLETSNDLSDFTRYLAAYSRGNAGAAWAIWRRSIQYDIDDEIDEKVLETVEADKRRTLWVKRWSKLEFLDIGVKLLQPHLFLLHTILLHNGLPVTDVALLLPAIYPQAEQSLYQLQAYDLIEKVGDRWQVRAARYPAVRGVLNQEGFLCDQL
jgi:hypothetical protein